MRRARDLGSVLVLSGHHAVTGQGRGITEDLKSLNLRMAGEMIIGGIVFEARWAVSVTDPAGDPARRRRA
jgi:hypothetical protein